MSTLSSGHTNPMSKQFGWVQDKFGVSWQLNVPLEN
ncbi:VOC family protein [Halobacillus seohaensis]|uniref:VOC family protein n=1 Tax=Halobacillus seohaensis TaxID=447421 RepID=A0ABW2EMG9_9BACI